MASQRLITAQNRLNSYYAAETAVLSGQSYSIGSRSMTRADLGEIRQAIKDLERQVAELQSLEAGKGRRRAFRITLRDI